MPARHEFVQFWTYCSDFSSGVHRVLEQGVHEHLMVQLLPLQPQPETVTKSTGGPTIFVVMDPPRKSMAIGPIVIEFEEDSSG